MADTDDRKNEKTRLPRLPRQRYYVLCKTLEEMKNELTAEGSNWNYRRVRDAVAARLGEGWDDIRPDQVGDALRDLRIQIVRDPRPPQSDTRRVRRQAIRQVEIRVTELEKSLRAEIEALADRLTALE